MPLLITSLQNPRIKHTVKLRERRMREREQQMLVEGFDELVLALESGLILQTLFVCPELFAEHGQAALMDQVETTEIELIEVTREVFEKIAYRENPDGWLAIAPGLHKTLADIPLSDSPFLIIAEAIEKPGNLGAILRSADATGVDGLILCDPTTDLANPNVVRSSKGTLFSVPVAEAEGEEALAWLRDHGITIVAATPQADLLYTEADFQGPVAIAVGTEKYGLSEGWLAEANVAVRIPMAGRVNSLNVATSTALLLYEVVRQRRTAKPIS